MTTEYAEMADVIADFRDRWPEHSASLRPSMNGVCLSSRKWGSIMWNKMKSLGADEGDPDLAILLPKGGYCGLIIEHKGENQPHKLSEGQEAQIDYYNGIGYCAVSTRGRDALWACIVAYMEQ